MKKQKIGISFFMGWRLIFAIVYLVTFVGIKTVESGFLTPEYFGKDELITPQISEALSQNIISASSREINIESLILNKERIPQK